MSKYDCSFTGVERELDRLTLKIVVGDRPLLPGQGPHHPRCRENMPLRLASEKSDFTSATHRLVAKPPGKSSFCHRECHWTLISFWKIADQWTFRNRSFLKRAYPTMKKNNPNIPILIREATGIEPKVWARYGTESDGVNFCRADMEKAMVKKHLDHCQVHTRRTAPK